MNPGDLKRSKLRLAELLAMNAPEAILRGEARILLARIEGGKQKAIIAWQWSLILKVWTDSDGRYPVLVAGPLWLVGRVRDVNGNRRG